MPSCLNSTDAWSEQRLLLEEIQGYPALLLPKESFAFTVLSQEAEVFETVEQLGDRSFLGTGSLRRKLKLLFLESFKEVSGVFPFWGDS